MPRIALHLSCLAAASAAASHLEIVGFTDLQARYGTNLASGAGVVVAQVEGDSGAGYVPNTNIYPERTFVFISGASGVSDHASTVASYYYGANSVSPGTTNIRMYEAIAFMEADGLLRGSRDPPLDPSPARIINNSWVSGDTTAPTSSGENDILQRIDHVVDAFGATVIAGINNGDGPLDFPLLSQAYNVIAVGISAGSSRSGPAFADAAGRAKPDIVAPLDATSWGAAMVSGASALLIDSALSSPSLSNAADPRIVKALLLTSAAKPIGWHKGDLTEADDGKVPLDWRFGAGDLRINRAYDLLNAGEVGHGAVVTNSAWDLGSVASGSTNWYYFSLNPTNHAALKTTLVWHRRVEYKKQGINLNVTVTTQNLNLVLFTASGTTPLSPVAASTSAVDNVEHLWVTNFPAGGYAIGVTGDGAETYGLVFDAVPSPIISIYGIDTNAAEFGPDGASFLIRRDGSSELATTVNLQTSGTASNGADYVVPASVIFAPGQSSVTSILQTVADDIAEGPETATISIAPGVGYMISSTNHATALIADRPFDQWRFDNFTTEELADPAISGDAGDPDGDGGNLIDYASGDAPKVFNPDLLGQPGIVSEDGNQYLSLTFFRRPQPSDVTDIIEVSDNLIDWSADAVQVGTAEPKTDGSETVTFRDIVPVDDADRRFIRRRVERILD